VPLLKYAFTPKANIGPQSLHVSSDICGAGSHVRFTRKRTCSAGYSSMRSINVGSSPAAVELFTLRDTGYICSDL
jgi:hypothetical protein